MALNIRFTQDNSENAENVVHKTKQASRIPKRLALGEIGNKVEPREFTVTDELEKKTGGLAVRDKNVHSTQVKPKDVVPKKKLDAESKTTKPVKHPSQTKILPPNVKNIDEDDDNLFLVSDYVNDVYNYLLTLEDRFPVKANFLYNKAITGKMRATLIDWLVEVQIQYNLLHETLHITVAIIDRYLQATSGITRDNLQLLGVSAMFLACKYEEIYLPELSDFIYISDFAYSKHQILAMEREVLKLLSYDLGRPISLAFLRRYSKAAKSQALQHTYGKYFLELALLDHNLSHIKPSLIAAAAMYISHCIVGDHKLLDDKIWSPTVEYYSTYKYSDFANIVPKLAKIIKNASVVKLQAVHTKYANPRLYKVSLQPAVLPDSKILQQLCTSTSSD